MAEPVPPAAPAAPAFTWDDVQAAIKDAVDARDAQHATDLENLRQSLTPAGGPLTLIPRHAGGPGTEVAATWSLAEQEAARAAEAAEAAEAAAE